ncbi:contact-dependent growth inhibition system immunity protein [Curtobacterium sp. ER1/6]|uniref:contact-dependent growth inhibition system immunity protein n=1 Tax=Curtobacterium sp. ER1/6 TaxID=1891920 RepID=UPI001CB97ABE|nr:contact-dependent growth inhibition system immunity protein [Curtobacterium sp. ER1/6]
MESSPPYPAFDSLMGGAFNQDWRDEWTSVDEVLSEAPADHPATRSALLSELLRIRETCSEADVVDLLESMGSGFRPEIDAHLNALGWVDRLVDRINALDATHE